MVKGRIFFIFSIILFNSCSTKNEYGYLRVKSSRFKNMTNIDSTVYNLIDTNSIYKLIRREYNNASGTMVDQYYKFFPHGKVGLYYSSNQNFQNKILESKKGLMGYYNFYDNKIIAKFYYKSWHGNGFKTDTLKVKKDTLVQTQLYLGAYIISIYEREVIPKIVKVTNPDW